MTKYSSVVLHTIYMLMNHTLISQPEPLLNSRILSFSSMSLLYSMWNLTYSNRTLYSPTLPHLHPTTQIYSISQISKRYHSSPHCSGPITWVIFEASLSLKSHHQSIANLDSSAFKIYSKSDHVSLLNTHYHPIPNLPPEILNNLLNGLPVKSLFS